MTLTVTQLYKHIDQQPVIDGVDFQLPLGQIVGLVGRNGAGKTTLMRLLANEILPERGTITGAESLFYLDVPDNFMKNYTLNQINKILPITYPKYAAETFWQVIDEQKIDHNKTVGTLSKGQRALVYIAAGLASRADYILLDEPLDGLDVLIRDTVKRLLIDHLAAHESTILIASHNLVELDSLTDRILFMKDGQIFRDYHPGTDEKLVKVQLVFEGDQLPRDLIGNAHVLEQRGHMWVLLFESYTDETEDILDMAGLKYFEELPITSEDVFRATFEAQGGLV
ncbi:MAG TPA: ATP-binding cassette domain-containing protein [Lactobacillaceae bacterium]|jgi:ABC-2 type transport system ATP-binding protein